VLEQQVKSIEELGGAVNETHLREGRAEEEIVKLAEEIGAGLIVLGSRGHGRLRRALMGSKEEVERPLRCRKKEHHVEDRGDDGIQIVASPEWVSP
jgi:Universal stress protein family